MKTLILGLGVQGKKRKALLPAGDVITLDPYNSEADYSDLTQVSSDRYDAVFLCTPDQCKTDLLRQFAALGKSVLVEKPLSCATREEILDLDQRFKAGGGACYSAYNHRFEPHIAGAKKIVEEGKLGRLYSVSMFYGNGTARDVLKSPWRDSERGVLGDLGPHLLDILGFATGSIKFVLQPFDFFAAENKSFDIVRFGSSGDERPRVLLEATLLSWRNTYRLDILGEEGSLHIDCLCKWGPSTLRVRKRKLPSGRPDETESVLEQPDPTWALEHSYFYSLCGKTKGVVNLESDLWIHDTLESLSRSWKS